MAKKKNDKESKISHTTDEASHHGLFVELSKKIAAQMNDANCPSVEEIYKQLSLAPNVELGHVAFPCFLLAKAIKKAPPLVASHIADGLTKNIDSDQLVSTVEAKGPYLNFFIRAQAFGKEVVNPIIDGSYFSRPLLKSTEKVMFEYSQPNTHKELHIGHMRNLCLGDSLVRIHRYTGNKTIAATYPGDSGAHVAKCLWYLKYKYQGELPTEKKGEWLGKIYSTANLLLEDEKGTPQEDENRAQLTEILKQLHSSEGEFHRLWTETRQWSLDLMRDIYRWANVSFDRWFYESEVDAPSVSYVHELHQQGKLEKDDGAIGLKLEEEKLGFCILLKTDGTGLYSTKDVELARRKFEDFEVEKSIYVVDNRQSFHFQQVFAVLGRIGFQNAAKCHHLAYELVELPEGAMSSRKGNIFPLTELIDKIETEIKSRFLAKYDGDWKPAEIDKTATQIAMAAIKYGMIRVDNNRKIIFNMEDWIKLEGETGPYLQYSRARVRSLCEKVQPSQKADWSEVKTPQEFKLLNHLGDFNHTVYEAARGLKTVGLCAYLYDLSKLFNSFYAECSIANAETPGLQAARIEMAKACGLVLEKGLDLLGIPSPDRM